MDCGKSGKSGVETSGGGPVRRATPPWARPSMRVAALSASCEGRPRRPRAARQRSLDRRGESDLAVATTMSDYVQSTEAPIPMWTPQEASIKASNMLAFIRSVRAAVRDPVLLDLDVDHHPVDYVAVYHKFWKWSVDNVAVFWKHVLEFTGMVLSKREETVFSMGRSMVCPLVPLHGRD